MEKDAKIINTENTNIISKSVVSVKFEIVRSSVGNNGTINLRIKKTDITLGKPKYKAVL